MKCACGLTYTESNGSYELNTRTKWNVIEQD